MARLNDNLFTTLANCSITCEMGCLLLSHLRLVHFELTEMVFPMLREVELPRPKKDGVLGPPFAELAFSQFSTIHKSSI